MANGKKKNRKKLYIFGGLGLLIVILVAVLAFGGNKEKIVSVQTTKVRRTTITQTVNATGKIQPQTQVKINAEVSGEIVDILVKEGDRVKRGQLLVRIKPDLYVADREQAEAGVNSARSFIAQRTADLSKVESEFKRANELHGKGLISDADLENAKAGHTVAKENLSSAKFSLENAEAMLKRSRENLAKTSIFSPLDGVISQLISKTGERVSGSSFMQGTEIMTISNLNVMEARVQVDENDVILISIGDTARVEIDAFPNHVFTGTVYQIANTATTKGLGTQEEVTNFEVRILLNNESYSLRPGMSCSAQIETDTRANVLAVPLQSVTTQEERRWTEMGQQEPAGQGEQDMAQVVEKKKSEKKKPQEVVFVLNAGLARKRSVRTGISNENDIEILEGLKEGEEIVKGNYRAVSRDLDDSVKVRIENAQRSGAGAPKK
jgi:HlyD family secretion protein